MRIPNAYIPAQISRVPTSSPASQAAKSPERPQPLDAADSYNRNGRRTSAPVIDAEYVEFYSPSTQVFEKERQNLDLSLETEAAGEKTAENSPGKGNPAITSYRTVNAEPAPPPGTYINIFA